MNYNKIYIKFFFIYILNNDIMNKNKIDNYM